MDAQRRLDLINSWTANENKINELVKELNEANKLKEKIENEIPSLRETGKWEIKFLSPKKTSEAPKTTTYKGQPVTASKKRKLKEEEALRKKLAILKEKGGDPLDLLPKRGLDQSQNFNRPEN